MRSVLALLTSLTFLACATRGHAAPAPASTLHSLSPEEFAKAGLNKLTADELIFLEEVLARRQSGASVAETQIAPAEKVVKSTDKAASTFGAEQVAPVHKVVTEQELHARIEGTIESFSGRAVFVLDNGQIWQQRIPDTMYFTPKLENPEVIITRGLVGYKMLIVEANRVVFVKRIQ
jgi:hypothetical protein